MRPHQPEEMLKCPGSAQFASYGLDTLPQVAGVKISKVTPYRTEQAQHPTEKSRTSQPDLLASAHHFVHHHDGPQDQA